MSDDLGEFRKEMRRRGVYQQGRRVVFRAERERLVQKKAIESSQAFVARAIADTKAKLETIAKLPRDEIATCPVSAIFNGQPCHDACRCGGCGFTTIGILVDRYAALLEFLEHLAGAER